MTDASLLTAITGLVVGGFSAYWTAKTFYLKRQDETRDRQRLELQQAEAEIQRQKAARETEVQQYAEAKKREYAAERDFGHLMRQYDALNINLTVLHDFQEKRVADVEADLRDIKSMLNILLIQAGGSETGIAKYLKREE